MLLLPIAESIAQTPTHIDPGTNDPAVNMWDNPLYIVLTSGIIIFAFVFLFVRNRNARKKRE
jgi:hypothetical protein